MGERKVLNKYYPIDFDPRLIPKAHVPKNRQYKIRMELPMNLRCDSCGEFMYQGKRFNARKESVDGETYLGLRLFRFYLRCVRCCAEFTIKTDLENHDYVCEHGVTRNFEPWREEKEYLEKERQRRMEEEDGDTMAKLENKTIDSKKEMEDLDLLDEMKADNDRKERISFEKVAEAIAKKTEEKNNELDEEAQAELRAFKSAQIQSLGSSKVKRIDDDDEEEKFPVKKIELFGSGSTFSNLKRPAASTESSVRGGRGGGRGGGLVTVVKRRRIGQPTGSATPTTTISTSTSASPQSTTSSPQSTPQSTTSTTTITMST